MGCYAARILNGQFGGNKHHFIIPTFCADSKSVLTFLIGPNLTKRRSVFVFCYRKPKGVKLPDIQCKNQQHFTIPTFGADSKSVLSFWIRQNLAECSALFLCLQDFFLKLPAGRSCPQGEAARRAPDKALISLSNSCFRAHTNLIPDMCLLHRSDKA